jgi:signal transduction histidine kinase
VGIPYSLENRAGIPVAGRCSPDHADQTRAAGRLHPPFLTASLREVLVRVKGIPDGMPRCSTRQSTRQCAANSPIRSAYCLSKARVIQSVRLLLPRRVFGDRDVKASQAYTFSRSRHYRGNPRQGSIVLPIYRALREPLFWHKHRLHIAVGCGVVLLQSMLAMALLTQARRRRIAEFEAEQQRQQLTHLTRVGVLGELSGAFAHELNQPLTAILSNAQAARLILEQEPVNLDEIRDILDDIVHDDRRAGGVIHRLRGLMKKNSASFQPLDFNSVVREVLDLAHSDLIGRNVAVNTVTFLPSAAIRCSCSSSS